LSRSTRRKNSIEGDFGENLRMMGQVMLLDISDEAAWRPPSDVLETSEEVIIRMEIPGVPAEDVEVMVRGERIEVYGEKQPDTTSEEASFLCLERTFGRFHRGFDVNGPVNISRIVVTLKGGVLALHLPKILERRGRERKVPIVSEDEE